MVTIAKSIDEGDRRHNLMEPQKQIELCYQDTLKVIADAKQKLFDITRWIISLHALVLGAVFSKQIDFSWLVLLLPVFIGFAGLYLHHAVQTELTTHRRTLAVIRNKVGGLLYECNKDHVDYFLKQIPPRHQNYYLYYTDRTRLILMAAMVVSLLAVLGQRLPWLRYSVWS